MSAVLLNRDLLPLILRIIPETRRLHLRLTCKFWNKIIISLVHHDLPCDDNLRLGNYFSAIKTTPEKPSAKLLRTMAGIILKNSHARMANWLFENYPSLKYTFTIKLPVSLVSNPITPEDIACFKILLYHVPHRINGFNITTLIKRNEYHLLEQLRCKFPKAKLSIADVIMNDEISDEMLQVLKKFKRTSADTAVVYKFFKEKPDIAKYFIMKDEAVMILHEHPEMSNEEKTLLGKIYNGKFRFDN